MADKMRQRVRHCLSAFALSRFSKLDGLEPETFHLGIVRTGDFSSKDSGSSRSLKLC